jgi:methylenetetrahydrofolate--tRNA-(uracil-5-)-methyltransferase
MNINIIGAGFAGVEAAFYLAKKGYCINLFEMRDKKMTPAHKTSLFAELVCSNSFKSISIENAHGLLKKELQELDSIIIKTAYMNKVPAGNALAVDRNKFSSDITKIIKKNKNINFINKEIISLDNILKNNELTIIATGPLTSDNLKKSIIRLVGQNSLFFFDAASPIIEGDSIDFNKVFFQSRYDKGGDDYLNCPLNKDEYENLVNEIIKSKKVELHDFESKKVYEGCIPIEVLAERGIKTLSFGPMKPVGIINPKTGKQPYAVLQLRQENINKTIYNMVGFQTRMKWNEQKRIFRMIPGLENCNFVRYGVIHKNTFLNYPKIINKQFYSIKNNSNIYFAGQITGVEGYIESAASGLYNAYAIDAKLNNKNIFFPDNTIIGALQKYTITDNSNYQPLGSNFGLLNKNIVYDENNKILKGRNKKAKLAEYALLSIKNFINKNKIL